MQSEKLTSRIAQLKRVKTLISLVYNGAHKPHSIEQEAIPNAGRFVHLNERRSTA